MSMDQIEKQVLLRTSIDRVWRAISDADEFGSWFGMRFDQSFTAGAHMTGRITPTTVDPEMAAGQEPYAGSPVELWIEAIDPPSHFAFRWHPYAVEPDVDYSKEPTTLVTFDLEERPEGTLLTIRESGFESIPIERRAEAFEMNEGGWEAQTTLIEKYLAQAA